MGADNSKDKKLSVDHFKQAFGDVRILVIGGSGAGKSALIRCMGFGDELAEVPQSAQRRAPAGQQDMAKVPVWKHPELPLFIHDTNGVGSNGKARVGDISKFLEADHPWLYRFWRRIWRAAPSISDRVQLVWFVLSATDNRILEFNAELMELVGKHRIPVQIIVTHLDQVTPGAYNRNVGNHLDELLAGGGLSADASQKVKESIVKVGLAQRGDLDDDAYADEDAEERLKRKQALGELSRRTAELLDEKQQGQRLTWAAAQSVDVRAKLQETAKLVVCRQYLEWAEYFSPAVVSVDKKALLSLLRVVRDNIGAIWGAPPALKEAVWETVGVWSDGLKTPLLLQLLSMAVTVPVAAPIAFGLVSWFFAFWEQTRGSGFRKVFVTYSLLVAACFMLVRTRDPVTWASRTVQEYTRLLQDDLATKGLKRMLQSGKIRGLLGLYGQDNVEEMEAFTEYFEEEEAVQRG